MQLLGTTPFPDNTKGRKGAARAVAAARGLGMDAGDVVAIVRCGMPARKIADILGLPLERIKEVGRAYSDAGPATGATATNKSAKSTLATEGSGRSSPALGPHPPAAVQRPRIVPAIPRCESCGGPIGFNGRCQCS